MSGRTAVTLNFVERGAGTPVLALHGWTPDHRLMLGCLEPVFARRGGYRRLYPDLPGMGGSPAPESVAGSDDVLDAVQDFVDRTIGDEAFLVVGESYGGYLGRALAGLRPRQVVGLALICPIGVALADADRTLPPYQVLRRDPELLASLDPRVAERFAEVAVVQSPRTLRRFCDEVLPGLDAADAAALERIFRGWRLTADLGDDERYDRPALILTGRQDAMVGYQDQFALLPRYPRATFAVLDLAGHNAQIEQPGLFDALVCEWLDRVAAES